MYICRYWTGGVPRSRTPSTSWRRTTSELQETVNPGHSRRSPCGRYSYENCSARLSCDSYKTKFHLVVLPHSLPNKYRNFSHYCIKCQIHFIVTLDIIIHSIMLIFKVKDGRFLKSRSLGKCNKLKNVLLQRADSGDPAGGRPHQRRREVQAAALQVFTSYL